MRSLRELLDGNTVTPEERKRRRAANDARFWRDQTMVTPLERQADERIFGRTLGRFFALFSAGE